MCVGRSPQATPPPEKTPEAARAPVAPSIATSRTSATDDAARRRRAGGTGTGTILTGARGIQDGAAPVAKTLLGQ